MIDALTAHLSADGAIDWTEPFVPKTPVATRHGADGAVTDAHARFIETMDRSRDPVRAMRMREALAMCRARAMGGEALTLAGLARIQAHVLGVTEAHVRSTDAYAKGGDECYGARRDVAVQLDARLQCHAMGDRAGVGSVARATRAYLDLCFFHPFADGNARAARLAFDWLLASEGITARNVHVLFTLAIPAGDVAAYRAWWHIAERACATGRREGDARTGTPSARIGSGGRRDP